MTNVTCGLTAKKPGSALCSMLVVEYRNTLHFFTYQHHLDTLKMQVHPKNESSGRLLSKVRTQTVQTGTTRRITTRPNSTDRHDHTYYYTALAHGHKWATASDNFTVDIGYFHMTKETSFLEWTRWLNETVFLWTEFITTTTAITNSLSVTFSSTGVQHRQQLLLKWR